MLRSGAFAIPPAPMALTIGGLMPFFGASLAIWALIGQPVLQSASTLVLLNYGAVILSFLGGARWGVEVDSATFEPPRWGTLIGSVLGALYSWVLVLIYSLGPAAPIIHLAMAIGFAVQWGWDIGSRRALPVWYDGLRTLATLGAIASLVAAWVALEFGAAWVMGVQ